MRVRFLCRRREVCDSAEWSQFGKSWQERCKNINKGFCGVVCFCKDRERESVKIGWFPLSLPGWSRWCISRCIRSEKPSPSSSLSTGDSLPMSQSLSPASLSPRPLSFRLNLSMSCNAYLQDKRSQKMTNTSGVCKNTKPACILFYMLTESISSYREN